MTTVLTKPATLATLGDTAEVIPQPATTLADPTRLIDPVEEKIVKYYPNLFPAVKASLAVFGAMALKDRTKPLSLIFEAASGFGKTAVLQMAFPMKAGDAESVVYRSDKFTPKAFVTHAANVKAEELAKMDLLPKLKDRVLISKELAPIFRGRDEELRENFSVLISVLDGKGFTSDTGMRGRRGYQESIIFNWLGATTPLPPAIHRLMSQLGTRLLFYEIPATQPTEEQLMLYAEGDTAAEAEYVCQRAVNEFLSALFRAYPIGSVTPKDIPISQPLVRQLVRWAQFLVAARAEVKCEKSGGDWEPVAANTPEAPFKVVTYFMDLARGHALIDGRHEVTEGDLALVGDVAISSVPAQLRPIIRELRRCDSVDTSTCTRLCAVTSPTARHYLKELSLLGICDLSKGASERGEPDRVRLTEAYSWLRQELER